jgi:serpin B
MMKKEGNQLYFENDMLQATRQAYYGGAYMDIYLPKEGYALDDVLGSLNSLSPQFQTADGTLKLPRFTTDYGKGLNDALKELGITDVFEGGLDDLATGPYDLYLSDAFQKARIEVDEEGTKAAAVTVLVVGHNQHIRA